MSDSNPFSDPTKTERFDEKKGRPLIADTPSSPLIPAALKPAVPPPPAPTAPKKDLDDYNPFDDAQQPAEPKPADKPPRGAEGISWFGFGSKKKYTVSGGDPGAETEPPSYLDTNTAAMRELKQREEELAKREQAIREREERDGQPAAIRPNNFPPLPKFFPVKPCFYHDISVEIPPEQQKLVKAIFVWWIVHCSFYIVNFVLAFVGMITIIAIGQNPGVNQTFFANFGFALALLVFLLPSSLFCLYLPLYRAFKNDSSMNFMCFFFVCVFQFGIYICHGFGIPGGCGMILAVFLFSSPGSGNLFLPLLGGVYLIFGILWLVMAGILAFFVYKVHRYYRLSGASLAAARQEMFSTAASNETVRAAVRSGIKEAATNEAVRSAVADGVKTGVKTGFQVAAT